MSTVIVTGSAGLVGSETASFFASQGHDVVGIDNDMRSRFFGPDASTLPNRRRLQTQLGQRYHHADLDIRDREAVERLFRERAADIALVVHAAAQPSHDWAATEPRIDFEVNALGTLNLLESTRAHAPDAVFIFVSTNKVYGDTPNALPLVELDTRFEIEAGHRFEPGIDETMSIDQSKHSLFGVSKAAADLMVQEYGRYFGLRTVCFRGGCLTGPRHAGTRLHGFLAYLMKCTITGTPYTVFGYKGKQVRDNIHSADLVAAFDCVLRAPRVGEVYNMGGGRHSHCSMLEAISLCEELAGRPLVWDYSETNRSGDHIWYVSDVAKFKTHYPDWRYQHDLTSTLTQMHATLAEP